MNTTMDLISVIVTNYNHAKYLDQRMESLLNQTYPNLEIIVIDNCSTDNSLEVLAKYKKHAYIKIVALEKNGGFVNSCNLGVSMARGEFFMFAEADDYNAPTEIERLHEVMAGNKQIGVAFCRSFIVDPAGKILEEDFVNQDRSFKEFCTKDTFISRDLAQRFFLFSCIIPNYSAVLFRKKYYELAGGLKPLYKACPDWEFWFRLSQHCDFYYVTSTLNYYRRHGNSYVSLLGLQVILTDIMRLLYTASRKIDLSFWERFWFRVNIGLIWGRYRKPAPALWWKCFPSVWRESLKYDKLSVLFLVLAFIKRVTERAIGRA